MLSFAVALSATACSGDFGDLEGEGETATETAGIWNGIDIGASELNTSGLVAVYHPKFPDFPNFYPRPCSGVIVRSVGGMSTVLTARHCVTTNNHIDGPLVPASALRLTPTLSPGPALPDPPPYAIPAAFVMDKMDSLQDIAVVYVQTDWSSIANNRIGLYVGNPTRLVSNTFTAYGYGINDADGGCGVNHSTVGAGTARSGAYFSVTAGYVAWDGQPASYAHTALSSAGQALYCGDSGGPDELVNAAGRVLLGVHSTGATTEGPVYSTAIDLGMQNRLSGLYMRPANAGAEAMLGEDQATGNVVIIPSGGAPQTTLVYDSVAQQIWLNGRCVSAISSFWPPSIAWLAWCNTSEPTQLWTVYPNGQVVNPITGKCLSYNPSTGVLLASCVVTINGRTFRPSSTLWTFRAQP
jgi:hypothetical protein